MKPLALALAWLLLAAPVVAGAPLTAAQTERLKAFHAPLEFTSKGLIKLPLVKLDRDLLYTFGPVKTDGAMPTVQVSIVDRAHGNKMTKEQVELTARGTLHTGDPALVNACNVAGYDPALLARLRASEKLIHGRGQMEVSGSIVPIEVTHHRTGEVADDGSMRVESVIESENGSAKLTSITILAPDGLPWVADTTGTVAKGPITIYVTMKLERQGVPK